jgi:RimJ/RimL family protein N-acetyltransferase
MPSVRLTERLRLEPITRGHARDLFTLMNDDGVAHWYGGAWSTDEAERFATDAERAWDADGVHKWMAYDRVSRELIGRGGLSRVHVDGAPRLEIGWAVRDRFWGQGFASEIGRAALAFAFDDLDVDEVVAYTEPHNARSRAVMERIGMRYARDITHEDTRFVFYVAPRPQA